MLDRPKSTGTSKLCRTNSRERREGRALRAWVRCCTDCNSCWYSASLGSPSSSNERFSSSNTFRCCRRVQEAMASARGCGMQGRSRLKVREVRPGAVVVMRRHRPGVAAARASWEEKSDAMSRDGSMGAAACTAEARASV